MMPARHLRAIALVIALAGGMLGWAAGPSPAGEDLPGDAAAEIGPSAAGAMDGPPEPAGPAALVVSPTGLLLRVGLGLALVFGILGAVLFLYRKATRGRPGKGGGAAIQLLSQRSLGQRTSLAVVRVAGETLLIGVTPQQVSSLARIEDEPAGPALPAASPQPGRAWVPAAATRRDAEQVARRIEQAQPDEESFARTLASEIKRVRESVWTPLTRIDA
jgi:flagellar biosynthetic protein FliO